MAQSSGNHISQMHLFYQLKQQYPNIPDKVVSHCIKMSSGNEEACKDFLEKEAIVYVNMPRRPSCLEFDDNVKQEGKPATSYSAPTTPCSITRRAPQSVVRRPLTPSSHLPIPVPGPPSVIPSPSSYEIQNRSTYPPQLDPLQPLASTTFPTLPDGFPSPSESSATEHNVPALTVTDPSWLVISDNPVGIPLYTQYNQSSTTGLSSADSSSSSLSSGTDLLIQAQLERKANLERELEKGKVVLKNMQKQYDEHVALLAKLQSSLRIQDLKREIRTLEMECQHLVSQLDAANPRDEEAACRTDSNGADDRLAIPEEDSQHWRCHICTFRNHPLLQQCDKCNMPQITLGTGVN